MVQSKIFYKTILTIFVLFTSGFVGFGIWARQPNLSSQMIPPSDTDLRQIMCSLEEVTDAKFFKFVTRPDIHAPRWDIKIYNRTAVAPGHWFTATYQTLEQQQDDNRAWVGPHIYDQTGELIWSGAPMFGGYNVKDFKVSPVRGTDMLTGIYASRNYDVIINCSYGIHQLVPVESGSDVDIHDFSIVDNGTRSLLTTLGTALLPEEEAMSLGCGRQFDATYPGFEERDTKTWELTFQWNARNRIHMNESFLPLDCAGPWDFMHANSVDKFLNGDYLLSARRTDTLYKISQKDGSIIWRLGGKFNDFEISDRFAGQHDARIRSENETHTVITIMDNAFRPGLQYFASNQSRGMTIVINTDVMTAEVISTYNHPHGSYAPGRGNFQVLPNGNVFLGWWMRSLISESSPDGKLLMEASWKPELKSYRSYKFNWRATPSQPPDVCSRAIYMSRVLYTFVYVSWNGATEVYNWRLYETNADGLTKQLIGLFRKQGFETNISYVGLASYVIVQGLDFDGNMLGESGVVKTVEMGGYDDTVSSISGGSKLQHTEFRAYLVTGVLCCILLVLVLKLVSGSMRVKRIFG